jgi:hypothetical protein
MFLSAFKVYAAEYVEMIKDQNGTITQRAQLVIKYGKRRLLCGNQSANTAPPLKRD